MQDVYPIFIDFIDSTDDFDSYFRKACNFSKQRRISSIISTDIKYYGHQLANQLSKNARI